MLRTIDSLRPLDFLNLLPKFVLKDRIFLFKMMPKNSICAEIGVYKGDNSLRILKIVKPKKLFLIDPWKYDPDYNRTNFVDDSSYNFDQTNLDLRYQITKDKMKDRKNVVIKRGKSKDVLKTFPDNYFDWLYIDGDHSFKAVLEDLEIAFYKLKPLGYITGDDYLVGEKANRTHHNVSRAVDEFLKNYPVKLIKAKNVQFIIQKLQNKPY